LKKKVLVDMKYMKIALTLPLSQRARELDLKK
jgi:hypothetical protein